MSASRTLYLVPILDPDWAVPWGWAGVAAPAQKVTLPKPIDQDTGTDLKKPWGWAGAAAPAQQATQLPSDGQARLLHLIHPMYASALHRGPPGRQLLVMYCWDVPA
jgi:hypothetical protein